jgi:hypothetical protein
MVKAAITIDFCATLKLTGKAPYGAFLVAAASIAHGCIEKIRKPGVSS